MSKIQKNRRHWLAPRFRYFLSFSSFTLVTHFVLSSSSLSYSSLLFFVLSFLLHQCSFSFFVFDFTFTTLFLSHLWFCSFAPFPVFCLIFVFRSLLFHFSSFFFSPILIMAKNIHVWCTMKIHEDQANFNTKSRKLLLLYSSGMNVMLTRY